MGSHNHQGIYDHLLIATKTDREEPEFEYHNHKKYQEPHEHQGVHQRKSNSHLMTLQSRILPQIEARLPLYVLVQISLVGIILIHTNFYNTIFV